MKVLYFLLRRKSDILVIINLSIFFNILEEPPAPLDEEFQIVFGLNWDDFMSLIVFYLGFDTGQDLGNFPQKDFILKSERIFLKIRRLIWSDINIGFLVILSQIKVLLGEL